MWPNCNDSRDLHSFCQKEEPRRKGQNATYSDKLWCTVFEEHVVAAAQLPHLCGHTSQENIFLY